MVSTNKQILQLLDDGTALTLAEIADLLEKKPKTVFKALRKLFSKEKIVSDGKTKRYSLILKKKK
jgi:DNA-binding IclR family transcriptional regulator